MNPILEPLTFPERRTSEDLPSSRCECLLCPETFDLESSGNDQILTHFLLAHKLVIADIKEIVDLKKYISNLLVKLEMYELNF